MIQPENQDKNPSLTTDETTNALLEQRDDGMRPDFPETVDATDQATQTTTASQKKSAIIAIVVLAVIVIVALVAYAALSTMRVESASHTTSVEGYTLSQGESGDEAILACTVASMDGQNMTLGDISQGRVTVINLWATWCPYCVAEMDDYQKLYDQFGSTIQFVMLDASDTSREIADARTYVVDKQYTFPVYYDVKHEVMYALGTTSLPTTAIISSDGKIIMYRLGQIEYEKMYATLASVVS